MSGKKTNLSSLETRKQLLLAESEVNRAELVKEWAVLKDDFSRVKKQVRTASSIASSAALLATAISLFRRRFDRAGNADGHAKTANSKMPWVSAALDGARMGASLFLKIRSLMKERR